MAQYEAHKRLFQTAILQDEQLVRLMQALGGTHSQVRVVGGAVRDVLRQVPVSDLDLACVHLPEQVIERAEAAGFKTVATGMKHGTVTVIGQGVRYEVTTLREDIDTDGRHAIVRFGTDWQRDMERRDFTMNALCVDSNGVLYDLVCGLEDCQNGYVRFIGDARQRIVEDALRIMRFFRFSAHFADGALDPDGLAAAINNVHLLRHLSAERIQAEFKKTLRAPDPDRLSRVMQQAPAVFEVIGLNLTGADFEALARCDQGAWALRAAVLWRSQPAVLQQALRSLKFSKADMAQIDTLNDSVAFFDPHNLSDAFQVRIAAYQFGLKTADDALYVLSRFERNADECHNLWAKPLKSWDVPVFPVKAADLMQLGLEPGPELGRCLARLEQIWMEANFAPMRDDLLILAGQILKKENADGRV